VFVLPDGHTNSGRYRSGHGHGHGRLHGAGTGARPGG
jgi:hypothetical protein